MDKYKKIYSENYYNKADGINEWRKPCLKFGDNFAAILYAHDINYLDCTKFFNINENGRDVTEFTLEEQFNYLNQNKKRTPKNILEIGGGRGEVANFLTYHKYNITSIEFSESAEEWYNKTAIQYFNQKVPVKLLNVNIKDIDFDLAQYDTIIMCESLEHIPEEHFEKFYNNIKDNFNGYFIITNWLKYHPIKANGDEHCRDIDDNLYDSFSKHALRTVFRNKSHLCLEYGKASLETD